MKKDKEKNCLREPTNVVKEPVVKKGSIVTLCVEILNSSFEPEIWKLRIIDSRESIRHSFEIDYCTDNSPLGVTIMGKNVGYIGKYKTDNGFAYRVKILDIENSEE